MAEPASQGGLHHEWSGPASIRGPSAFQPDALPTELPDRTPTAWWWRSAMAVLTGFEPATSGLTGRRALQTAPQDQEEPVGTDYFLRTPNGIRTRVTGVKGRRPRPLDDGGSDLARAGTRYQRPLS